MTPPPRTITEAGTALEPERVLGGEDLLAVDLEAGQRLAVGTGGEDDVLAGVRRAGDLDGVRAGEPALALDDRDPAGLDQAGEALEEPGDDAVLVGVHAGHVDALERGPDAELLALAGAVGDLGRVQQCLGRDAAEVEAGAAELALLDQRDAHAELGRAQRAGVAT